MQANPEWGYRVRGILDDHNAGQGYEYRGIQVIGTTEAIWKPILALNTSG